MSDAISVEGLRFAYASLAPDTPAPWVIDDLSFQVRPGEWLAVMGASDVGKTTLCYLLAGLAPHLTGGQMEGRVIVGGRDTRDHLPPALADTVGFVFQEPEAQLFNPTVEAEVAWGLENLGLPVPQIRVRLDRVLALLHLDEVRYRAPGELSGGEKKRLALASVLAMNPAVLILDEPMGGLDPAGRRDVLEALSRLRSPSPTDQGDRSPTDQEDSFPARSGQPASDRSVAIVMTESDPEAVAAFADRLLVLHQGRIVLEGSPRALFARADRLSSLGVAVPQMAQVAAGLNQRLGTAYDFLTVDEARIHLLPGVARGRPQVSPLNPSQQGGSSYPLPGSLSNSPSPLPHPDEGMTAACLEATDLWYWYDDPGLPVLRGLDLSVPRGQLLALVGANGSGKTTLIKHFNGLLRPRRGQIWVEGRDASHCSVGELARQVGFLFQHPEHQIFGSTVRQELAFGPRNLGLSAAEVGERVEEALLRFDLLAVADTPPAILSYGLRRRVTLASLAAMDPPILVLDEPTVGLDAWGLRETFDWLAELRSQGRTILLVTHDMGLVSGFAERMVVLQQGQILADGLPADLFRQPDLLAQASLVPPPVVALAQALRPHGFGGDGLSVGAFCDAYVGWVDGQR
jgi:energy-coupling factor transporter ATP-binding protein EcfA2